VPVNLLRFYVWFSAPMSEGCAGQLAVPPAGTCEPLQVTFGRPLDHGLLAWCLHVRGTGSELIDGTAQIGPGEQSWRRVFGRDLARPEDQSRPARPVTIVFHPG
jgi:hypothetical protein